jgi:subtilisin family serine protease
MFPRPRRGAAPAVVAIVLVAVALLPGASAALGKQPPTRSLGRIVPSGKDRPHAKPLKPASVRPPDRLIVKYRASATAAGRNAVRAANGLTRIRSLAGMRAEVVKPRAGESVDEAVARLRQDRRVEIAVPDYHRAAFGDPAAEPLYPSQWGLNNTGQSIEGYPGVSNVDIDAPEAFAVTQGSPNVTVAVIDDGVDFGHPDLAGQAWVNPGEIPGNGIDDDGNGFVDDVNGWDFCHNDASVHDVDEDFHGTGVAGVIAASANGVGITGVAPGVRIMALKFLGPEEQGCSTDDLAISAIEYAKAMGASMINASWGGPGYDPLLEDAIVNSGLLFVAASGNGGSDTLADNIDIDPLYPASLPAANIITVAAIHNQGGPTYFSNYGPVSVDLSAPGEDILVPVAAAGGAPATWEFGSGTSYAAPHVTGVAALIASVRPDLVAQPTALRARILNTSWLLSTTSGRTATGGVVDALYAVDIVAPVATPPSLAILSPTSMAVAAAVVRVAWAPPTDAGSGIYRYALQQSTNGGAWTSVGGTGTMTSTNRSLAIGTRYDFRVLAIDRAGNATTAAGPSFRPLRPQETSTLITYRGTWIRSFVYGASGSYTRYATRSTASATFRFTGRSVGLVMPKSRSRGSFRVYVDGAYVKTISLYSSTTKARQVVFSRSWAANGTHSVKLVPVGTAGHPRVDIDAFLILR